jgi:hypothetical protein
MSIIGCHKSGGNRARSRPFILFVFFLYGGFKFFNFGFLYFLLVFIFLNDLIVALLHHFRKFVLHELIAIEPFVGLEGFKGGAVYGIVGEEGIHEFFEGFGKGLLRSNTLF